MQTLKVSVSLPDETHADIELRLSAHDSDCDVVIALPVRIRGAPVSTIIAESSGHSATSGAEDDYVLGGYAGI